MKTPSDEAPFGRIELRRTSAGPRYKVMLGREVMGWATSLQLACERLWVGRLEQLQAGRNGPPNGGGAISPQIVRKSPCQRQSRPIVANQ